jgi:D-alanyl-lipoteichoic acid acyltransferase DltB (MBOAT superfamily)
VRPRAELDRLAARQLVTFAAKLLALIGMWTLISRLLPAIETFQAQPFHVQLVMILPAYVLFFLHTARQDLAAAFANLAGHYTPSPYRYPLLASNPVDYFRRWNIHVVEFIRRVFIYPVARRVRSVILVALSAMAGSALFHLFLREVALGPRMNWRAVAQTPILIHFVVGMLLALTLPAFSRRRTPLPLAARVGLILVTQLALAAEI